MNAPVRDATPPTRSRSPRNVDLDTPPPLERAAKTGAVGYVASKRTAYGQGEETVEEVTVPVFHTHPARVRVSGSITKNLGDYNSARVEVAVEMPCLPERSEVERVYLDVSRQVDLMLRRELHAATGGGL